MEETIGMQNKEAVRRFNLRVIQEGDRAAFEELMAEDFVNRSAPPGTPNGREAMWDTFHDVLRPGLFSLRVVIHDQIAEDEKVTTRKTITGVHEGPLLGIEPTHSHVAIDIIDIVRLENGQYVEHWGINTLPTVLTKLRQIRNEAQTLWREDAQEHSSPR